MTLSIGPTREPPEDTVAAPDPGDIVQILEVTGCRHCGAVIWRRARRRSEDTLIPYVHAGTSRWRCRPPGGSLPS